MEETIDQVLCPICNGEGKFLGEMGLFAHFSCRDCGMGFMKDIYEHAHFQEGEQNFSIFPFTFHEVDIQVERVDSYGDDLEETLTFEEGITVTDQEDIENTRATFILFCMELYQDGIKSEPIITFDFERKE